MAYGDRVGHGISGAYWGHDSAATGGIAEQSNFTNTAYSRRVKPLWGTYRRTVRGEGYPYSLIVGADDDDGIVVTEVGVVDLDGVVDLLTRLHKSESGSGVATATPYPIAIIVA